MKTVPLYGEVAVGRMALVDDADYELVMAYRWNVSERTRPNGSKIGPYAFVSIHGKDGGRSVWMHQLILPGVPQVDHRDGDGLNNQRSNLRPATKAQNAANEQKTRTYGGKPTSSRFKGIYWNKAAGKWQAQIQSDGKHRYLGIFADEADAARAYDAAARDAFGEFARVNFP